jgi:peptide/nickel transport system ATP-binding protein
MTADSVPAPTGSVSASGRSADIAQPVVTIRGLRVSLARGPRGGQRSEVIRGVDLDIARGEILALAGESGSGKSVLSLALMGLLPDKSRPRVSGTVTVTGTDMTSAKPEARRKVRRDHLGAVFQDPMTSLNPTTRAGRQVAEAAGSKAEAIRLMKAVGIPQPEQRFAAYPHELSGGLRQRVMIAMAIAGRPSLIIADEPTTALDVTVQAQVLRVLRDLRDDLNCSILMITHDLGVAAQVADRIAVMRDGEIIEQGAALEVLDKPEHLYTRRLLEARQTLQTGAAERPVAPVPENQPVPGRQPPASRLIELTEVHCDFAVKDARGRGAELHALRGVTAEVAAGESLALVGESGSGKTTLLRAIAGLETRWKGTISKPDASDIQMVFQEAGASLTPWLTVRELLDERLRTAGLTKQERATRVAGTLEQMGLPESALAARPAELSGGQRQRVALARATIVPPKVLLCDEPTSALDVSLAVTVLGLIRTLRREHGMTVLFVTHDLGVAQYVSDRVAVMYLGRLVESGPTREVIGNPRHPYTKALVDAVPGARKELPVISGEPASPLNPPSGCAFHPRCPRAVDECESTLEGTQLVALDHAQPVYARHEVACVHRPEMVNSKMHRTPSS